MYKILLVEDDIILAEILKDFFEEDERFEVLYAEDGESALSLYENEHPHLILLDIILPNKNGFEVIAEIREKDSYIPIILMTGTEIEPESEIKGYNLGAVNYLRKPVLPMVVMAQMERLLYSLLSGENYTIGDCHISIKSKVLKVNGGVVRLRFKDIRILSLLLKNQGEVVSRARILHIVWNSDDYSYNNKLDSAISRIRKAFQPFPSIIVEPVYAEGYIFREI